MTRKIVIVGLGCKFPGAENPKEFESLLGHMESHIQAVPLNRWDSETYDNGQGKEDGNLYCRWGGFVDDIDMFDPLFFKIPPYIAKLSNPEERLLLQVAWETIEHAGYTPASLKGETGVFVGVTHLDYTLLAMHEWLDNPALQINPSLMTLPNRISYHLGFKGPSLPVDSACSSTIHAIHLACQHMLLGECDNALVGAANLYMHPSRYGLMCSTKVLSNHKNPALLSDHGSGFVPGEGVGAILLKFLDDAERDGDQIYGIVNSSNVRHKGLNDAFLTPCGDTLTRTIRGALDKATLGIEDIDYVEGHFYGAAYTDLMEFNCLSTLLEGTQSNLRIGSVKPNVGHLEACAGMTQLFKVLFQFKNKTFYKTLNAETKLSEAVLNNHNNIRIQNRAEIWNDQSRPRRAIINGFGIGGVYSSCVIEEYTKIPEYYSGSDQTELFVLSAKSKKQLKEYAHRFVEYLRTSPEMSSVDTPSLTKVCLRDIAYTSRVGREAMAYRLAIIASDIDGLVAKLIFYIDDSCRTHKGLFSEDGVKQNLSTNPGPKLLEKLMHSRSFEHLALLWVQGAHIPWPEIELSNHNTIALKRVPLPSYPFKKWSCWITEEKKSFHKPKDVISRYYDEITELLPEDAHITFAPFVEKIEGFSWILTCYNPGKYRDEFSLVEQKQSRMREILYRHVDFSTVDTVMDIGCGIASDLIELGNKYSHITADGFTISSKQASRGQQRVLNNDLGERVKIHCLDSSRDSFLSRYDLFIGFEVVHHIRNKEGLFSNIRDHLTDRGTIVLSDCVANTVNAINIDDTGSHTVTRHEYAELLAKYHLQLNDCVDASLEISHFLYDENFEDNLAFISSQSKEMAAVEQEHRGWANFGKALAMDLVRYLLLTINHANESESVESLTQKNIRIFERALSFSEVSEGKKNPRLSISPLSDGLQPGGDIVSQLRHITSSLIECSPTDIACDISLLEYGVDSLIALKILNTINQVFNLDMGIQVFLDCNSIEQLADQIESQLESGLELEPQQQARRIPITFTTPVVSIPNENSRRLPISEIMKNAFSDISYQLIKIQSNSGLDIEFFKCGSGAPIILLPPLDATCLIWRQQILEFAKQYTVYSIHYPGYGGSQFSKERATLSAMTEDILSGFETLRIQEPMHLVGWSLGGILAQLAVWRSPSLFKSLTLVNTTSKLDRGFNNAEIQLMVESLRSDLHANDEYLSDDLRGLLLDQVSSDPKHVLHYVEEILHFDGSQQLSELGVPSLIIHGKKDRIISSSQYQKLTVGLKYNSSLEIDNAGHFIPLHHPKIFNNALTHFFRESEINSVD